jgi:hypothetical protein
VSPILELWFFASTVSVVVLLYFTHQCIQEEIRLDEKKKLSATMLWLLLVLTPKLWAWLIFFVCVGPIGLIYLYYTKNRL